MGDSPDVVTGKRLLDLAKHQGFQFQRIAPGPDAPLWGVRDSDDWRDTIYLGGFWEPESCSATRSSAKNANSPVSNRVLSRE